MTLIQVFLQLLALIIISPLITGVIRKIKNNLRLREGPGVFQPYYDLAKLFSKDEVVSANTSWIFRAAPYAALSSSAAALALIPAFLPGVSLGFAGGFIAVIFILSFGRFFMALAGLDAGSAFGGMGSSREMFIASFVEPAAMLAIFAVSVAGGTADTAALSLVTFIKPSLVVAAAAFFIVLLTETSRLPVDNRETHLELTMVHEAMALEYSGPSLGLIELASHIKQVLFMTIVVNVVLPPAAVEAFWPLTPLAGAAVYGVKLLTACAAVALLEVSVAKLRLFRVPDFLLFGFFLSAAAFVMAVAGI